MILGTTLAAVAMAQESLPTGAASAWTSDDAIVVQARGLIAQGELKDAAALVTANDDPKIPARAEIADIVGRIRRDYTMTIAQFMDKAKNNIPDITAGDCDRWAKAGELTARPIDGQLMIFSSEPSNLFKLSEEARNRRVNWTDKKSFDLVSHLAKLVDQADKTHERYVMPIQHHVTYTLTVPGNQEGAKAGSLLRVWLPFPQEYARQRDVKLISSSPENPLIAPSKDETQRTVYFEKHLEDPAKDSVFKINFQYTCYADVPQLSDDQAKPLSMDFPKKYLEERPPHIMFTPKVRQLVAQIVGKETNPLAKARKLWDWETTNIRYAFEDEYSTIASFSGKCLSLNKGDCGIQGTTFITLARAAGIPARWQSGWQTKPGEAGMHDWCEIYIEPWGWIVIDPSYGKQKSSNEKIHEFYLGHQDNYRMVVNFDYGRELTPPKPSLRSEPADFQRGEVELDGRNLYFDKWDYNIQVTHTPVE